LFFFELPIDSSSIPSVAEPGAVSDDETHRLYDKSTQGTRLDDPIVLREPQEHELAVEMRNIVLECFGDNSFFEKYGPKPPVRGSFGEEKIPLVEVALPVIRPSYNLEERMEIHKRLVKEGVASGKVEPGSGPWNYPSFVVPKKAARQFRLVQDCRPLNEVTQKYGHPLRAVS